MTPFQSIIPNAQPDSVATAAKDLGMLRAVSTDDLINNLAHNIVHFAISIVVAVVVFYIGKYLIRKIYNFVSAVMFRRKVDRSLTTFILSLVRIVLYFILIVTVIGILGINTSSFLAIFASAGVAIGMALSGTLQNFAGGVLILLLKPYKVGDYIETEGFAGTVREIQIFHTIITTYDNKAIIIPNGGLSTGSINNWSREDYRRVEWLVSISYGDSVDAARKAIIDMLATDDRIVQGTLEDDRKKRRQEEGAEEECVGDECPEPEEKAHGWLYRFFHRHRELKERIDAWDQDKEEQVRSILPPVDRSPAVVVKQLADSSVVISARAWVQTKNYWTVLYEYNEKIYSTLPSSGIRFPFPQMDVHIKDAPSKSAQA